MKKYIPYIVLIIFSIPLFFLHVTNAHGLGDDFAQYVKEAQNISKGIPYYTSNWVFNYLDWGYGPPQYPPGYPLLLAPVTGMFGIAIKPMLYMNSLIVMALLFALFAYFRKHTGMVAAVCLSIIIVYSNEILDSKGQLLSDIPCLLFVTLYLMVRNNPSFSTGRKLLLVCLATMVLLIRSQGLLLLGAEAWYLLIAVIMLARSGQLSFSSVKKLVSLWVLLGTAIMLLIINKLLLPAPGNTVGYYMNMVQHTGTTVWEMVKENAAYLLTLFTDLLHLSSAHLKQGLATTIENCLLVVGAAGLLLSLKRRLRADDLFFILMCAMIIFMPIHQGARFLYEAYPVYVLYCYTALKEILPRIIKVRPAIIAVAITAVYLCTGFDTYKMYSRNECDGCVPSPNTTVIFDYLKTHMSDSDLILCPRPRLFTLYTNKRAIVYASKATYEENKKNFDRLKVTYIMPWFDDNLRTYLRATHEAIDSVTLGDAVLYRVR